MTNLQARICAAAIAFAIVAGICMAPVAARGQSVGMNVTVPFDFYVGEGKFPAGKYTVTRAGIDPAVIQIFDRNGHSSMTLTNGGNQRNTSGGRLIFNAYEGYYFLAEVCLPESGTSRQLIKSPLELQIAKNGSPERVVATSK